MDLIHQEAGIENTLYDVAYMFIYMNGQSDSNVVLLSSYYSFSKFNSCKHKHYLYKW